MVQVFPSPKPKPKPKTSEVSEDFKSLAQPIDYSDQIAAIQTALRIMGCTIASPRVQAWLTQAQAIWARKYPNYAIVWPLPWLSIARIPDEILPPLADTLWNYASDPIDPPATN